MKLNKKLEIGINVVTALDKHDGFMRTADLAKEVRTTINFLEQIMRNLRTAKIVQVRRGPGGGYCLNKYMPYTAYDVAKAVGRFGDNLKHGDVSATAQLQKNIIEAFRNTKVYG